MSRARADGRSFSDLLDIIVPDGGAVVVLRYVYMDESGTHDGSPALSMAGYVFTKEQAQRFSRDWGKDLKRFGLPYGHMTDCATGNQHYAALSMTERIDSEKALIAHTRHRSMFGLAVAIDLVRYKQLFGEGRWDYDPYTFGLSLCLTGIHRWAQRTSYNGRFAYIFEAGHAAQAEANAAMNALREHPNGRYYASHSFVRKEDAAPIQAADMLAWQYAHFIKRRAEGHQKRRKDFDALLRPGDELQEFDAPVIEQWRALMDDLDRENLGKLPEMMPDITESELAWAAEQQKKRS